MIGRGAIRNPWIFEQIRQVQRGESPSLPSGRDVLNYVRALYDALRPEVTHERAQVTRLKKHMNYLGLGVDPAGAFLHEIRRVTSEADFFRVCASTSTTAIRCRWSHSAWTWTRAMSWPAPTIDALPLASGTAGILV
jgi:tRNA-dihydrouridine synthase